jgi:hypothetical protein
MKPTAVIILLAVLIVAAAVFIGRHREHVAELAASRLTRALESTPALSGAASVHRNGAQVSIWFLDTLSPSAKSQLDHIVVQEGKPLRVKLVPMQPIDPDRK